MFGITGNASEVTTDDSLPRPDSTPKTNAPSVAAAQNTSANVVLTVAVAPGGVTVRLYNELGSLVEQTPILTPPAVASLTAPGGSSIGLSLPGGAFSGSAIVDIYLRGLPRTRPIINETDSRKTLKGLVPFGDLGPVEFTATTEPAGMVTIALSYPPGSNPALLNNLKAYYLDKEQLVWRPVPSSRLDSEKAVVLFDVPSFEVFRLMTGSAENLRAVIVYPNPFRPRSAKDNVLKFIGLTDDARLEIFTISGDLVWRQSINHTGGGTTWDGRNLEGKEVASGLYVYQITNSRGEKNTGRISVIW
jgi:hypothetical protein